MNNKKNQKAAAICKFRSNGDKAAIITKYLACCLLMLMMSVFPEAGSSHAREIIKLSLDNSFDIVMEKSYRIKQLQMGIERTRYWLKAEQASLKSRVYMNLIAPEYKALSDYKWNSDEEKDELVRENTQLWQMDLAIKQPVLLLGYPTNGYLSLNNKIHKYIQRDGAHDVDYYNRYYLKFEQPFFLPNELKNDIEEAKLDLEDEELEYISDKMELVERLTDDYYDLFEYTYYNTIYSHQLENLRKIVDIAEELSAVDTTRVIDRIQAQVEMANVEETRLNNQIMLRRQAGESKQRLRLSVEDSIYVEPEFTFKTINIDVEQAIEHGFSLNPELRMLNINKRMQEIDVDNSKGWDAFHVNLEMTYGLEKQHERYQSLFEEYDNSYSASLNAYVPIWDWGRRKARIEAESIGLKQSELRIEEEKNEIQSDIIIAVENVLEYQQRTKNMMENMKKVQGITDLSIGQYKTGDFSIQDILQIVERQKDTEINFLEAYQGYKRSLFSLMMQTYYDYENDISLIDRFRSEN